MDELKKKLILKAAAGLGNQMFMYANAYSLAKEIGYDLYVDNTSGYFQKKNTTHYRKYALDIFNISAKNAIFKDRYDNYLTHNLKKIKKLLNHFQKRKSFLTDPKIDLKKTHYKKIDFLFSNKIYQEGYFESEKYFINYKNNLLKEFTIKNELIKKDNKFIKLLNETNSVSIHIRRDRFIEPSIFSNKGSEPKKDMKLEDVISYTKRGISFFREKIQNPKFFIWSNNFSELDKVFNKDEFVFVENNDFINDFHLFSHAKHFILGPSTFHWWGAWLNKNKNKICVRPPDHLNPSDNKDFWPMSWTIV